MDNGTWLPSREFVEVGMLLLRLKVGSCESQGDWPSAECPDWSQGDVKCRVDGSSAHATPVPFAEPGNIYLNIKIVNMSLCIKITYDAIENNLFFYLQNK